jgi:hypothetical protein
MMRQPMPQRGFSNHSRSGLGSLYQQPFF